MRTCSSHAVGDGDARKVGAVAAGKQLLPSAAISEQHQHVDVAVRRIRIRIQSRARRCGHARAEVRLAPARPG